MMKKRMVAIAAAISLICMLMPNVFALGGAGTESSPYIIYTAEDLNNVRNDLSAYYRLGANINLSGYDFAPIGNEAEGAFTGVLDGAGYTVSNLDITETDYKYAGLIGYLEGTVKNIILKNANVYGTRYVGGIAAYGEEGSVISGCKVSGDIKAEAGLFNPYAGGIAGYNMGTIDNCINSGDVSSNSYGDDFNTYAGGIAGYNYNGTISDCNNSGTISLSSSSSRYNSYAGGIAGNNYNGTISSCINSGTISSLGKNSCAGGIAGNGGTISNCSNSGTVSSDNDAGGIAGYGGTISGCSNSGTISSSYSYAGGIAGHGGGTISNCSNSGTISALNVYAYAGGIAGHGGTISSCSNIGTISASSNDDAYAGGIAGYGGGTISSCSNSGTISALSSNDNAYAGGIAGRGGTISNCSNSGDVTSNAPSLYGTAYAGGIFGRNGTISNCSNSGTISSNRYAGGIAGNIYNGTINNCINYGYQSGITINNNANYSYAVTNGASGLTVGELCDPENMPDLDFADTWYIDSSINNGFPTLRNMPRHIDLSKCVLAMRVGESESLVPYIDGERIAVDWSSADSSIASVGADGKVTAKALGVTTVTAVNSEGMAANCLVYVYNKITDLRLSENDITLIKGETTTLTAEKTPSDADEVIKWYTENSGIASVNQNGAVTANSAGTTKVRAVSVCGEVTRECTVTVINHLSSISISPSSVTINKGETQELTLTTNPEQFSDTLTWKTSNADVVTVDDGVIKAVGAGTAIVSVESSNDRSAQCTVTVKAPAQSISLSENNINMYSGFTYQLNAFLEPEDCTDTVSWSASSNIASVSNGLITAKRAGIVTITARTSNGRTAFCVVNISDMPVSVASVSIEESEVTMALADMKQLYAEVLPADSSDKSVEWSSSDNNICTVSNTGVVTAVGNGTAVIRAEANNGFYDECVVRVISASGPSVVVSDAKASPGGTARAYVSIVRNPGLSEYKFTVNYDTELLTPEAVIQNGDFGGTFKTNIDDPDKTALTVLWYSDGDTDINGELFSIDFKVNDAAEYGETSEVSVTYNGMDIVNAAGDNVALYTSAGEVSISEPLPGDIYEDGEITVHDLNLLSRYVTEIEKLSPRQLEAADVNNDGAANIKDVVKLSQYLVGWTGVELMEIGGNTADIKLGTVSADKDGIAYIPVSVENNGGVAGFRFRLDYNSDEIEVLEIIPNSELLSDNFMTNLGQEGENGTVVTWYRESDISADGELFTIKVRCKDIVNTPVSAVGITALDDNMCDQELNSIAGIYETGYVINKGCAVVRNEQGDTELYADAVYDGVSAVVIAAEYDEQGNLLQCEIKPVTLSSGRQKIDFSNVTDGNVRYFIWESLESMKPLG